MNEEQNRITDDNTQSFVVKSVSDFEQQIIDNKKTIAVYDDKYLKPLDPNAQWVDDLEVDNYRHNEHTVTLFLAEGVVKLTWLNAQILHVLIQPEEETVEPYFSYYITENMMIAGDLIHVQEQDDKIRVDVGDYRYLIAQNPLQISCYRHGDVIWEQASFRWQEDFQQTGLSVALQADEACFGTGERAFDLNLRGRELPMWNTDPGGYARGDDPINSCVSYYVGVHNQGSYGLLWDNPARAMFDLGANDRNKAVITGETNTISAYFFAGEDVSDVMQAYVSVTGRMPMPPMWALGYHQSRYSYMDEGEVLDVASELRERNIPCDVVYLDIHYLDENRVFTWNEDNFPDMAGMVSKLHDMNMRVVPILDPGVEVKEGYLGHDTGVEADIFVKYPDGEYASGVVWPGLCYFPDFTNPKTRTWWAEQPNALLSTGIDGIWNDMNEPLIFDFDSGPASLPDYVQHHTGTHKQMHNVYGMLMGLSSKMALEKHRPEKRQFTFTRAVAAGTQRYASSWTGDNHSTWDDLHIAITTTLQMGLSGIAFTGSDIGGFMDDTTGELLTRWMQAGAMMPFFRNHSAVDTIHQEPWLFGDVYEDAIRQAIQLRYDLMPYIYTAFAQNSYYGTPIIRPIFMAEPDNANIRSIDDSFLVGDNLLVAPVLKPSSIRRTVYLPDGDWYDFNTNERYHGGQMVTVDAPLDRLPLFVRSGAVMPMWDGLQHLSDLDIKTLKLRVFADSGVTTIYEDAGEGLAYQKGDYRWLTFEAVENTSSLTLTRSFAGEYQPSYDKIELQFVGARNAIKAIDVDGEPYSDWVIDGDVTTVLVPSDFTVVTMTV